MFFTARKLECRKDELKKYRYRDVVKYREFAVSEDTQGVVNPAVPAEFEGWDTLKIEDVWRGRDRYLWLHLDAEIPAEWAGRRAVGVFDFGMTGAGNNSGFEAMLYIDGKPYQGVDGRRRPSKGNAA